MASARQGRRVRNTREEECASSPFAYLTHRARISLASVRRKTDRRCKIEVLSCSAWVYGLEFLCPFRRVNFWLKTVIEMLREIIRLIFSIYSVWRRNKTKAKLWYEFNYSSSPLRKWLDNACKYWMIISPPFLINYTKKLLILDKITGVPSFTIDTDIGIRAIQLPSEIRCYLKNVEGLLQKGWRSDQSLIGFLLGCFLRHIVFRNKMLFSLKHYPGSDGDAYCHHQLRYMLDIRVPSFMQ